MKAPKISVVMPVYNCEKYVEEAVESVLNQTFKDFELIIVNDASTDSTLNIINKLAKKDSRIKVLSNETNLRIASSLNRAIDEAKADIIARMDGDDVNLPKRFEKQYALLQKNKDLGVVGCNMITINENGTEMGRRHYSTNPEVLLKSLFRYSPFAHPSTMYRKKVFVESGKYNPRFIPTEDLDLWIRMGKNCKFSNVDEFLFKYRVLNEFGKPFEINKVRIKSSFT